MGTPSWNLTDQDCNAFDLNWSKTDTGSAAASLVTYDSRSCYKFTCPQDGSANYSYVANTSLSSWTEGSFEMVFRTDNMSLGGYSKLVVYIRDASKYEAAMFLYWDTNWTPKPYIKVESSDNYIQQPVDWSPSTWHTMRIVMNSAHTVWGFFDGKLIARVTVIGGPEGPAYSANTMGVKSWGVQAPPGSGTRECWVDHLRASTTKLEPDYCGLITMQGANINTRYRSEGDEGSLDKTNPADSVRYILKNRPSGVATYACPVVATTDDLASKVRVQTTAGIKALQKYPTSF